MNRYRPRLEPLEDRCVPAAFVRVNQLGFAPGDPKIAWLMADAAQTGTFEVRDSLDAIVFTGNIGSDQGPWNAAFDHVHALDFTTWASPPPGTYTIQITASGVESPTFRINSDANLYSPILADASFFFRAQRDGPDVDNSVLNRQPSHLDDAQAFVYRKPTFKANGGLKGGLQLAQPDPIDVSGGWVDAADYLKFVATASYTAITMLMAVRDHGGLLTGGSADLADEARFGLDWLMKMWDETTATLYIQVGLANGNNQIVGDHDIGWQLPQADDALAVNPGDPEYFVRFRPVFRAAAPGAPISPNLAGRMAAAFALGYQVFAATDQAFADECLLAAQQIFDLAKAKNVTSLKTTFPTQIYKEVEWRDDMELGAAELYHAVDQGAGNLPVGTVHTDPAFYLQAASRWAHKYLTGPNPKKDTLNWRDVSALGHYETHRAISDDAGATTGLLVTQMRLEDHLRFVLNRGQDRADFYLFGTGAFLGDSAARVLGLALTASLYEELTGDSQFAAFGQAQVDWVLGGNAWGASFLVGTGSAFPKALHHQVANLEGTLTGTGDILRGAVVFGPANKDGFGGLGEVDGMNLDDPSDDYFQFTGKGVRYFDSVVSWNCVEPAIDYSSLLGILFARKVDGL